MTDRIASSAHLPQPLRVLLSRLLETVLNRLLALDPELEPRLAALDGQQVELHLSGPELRLRLRVEGGRLRVGAAGTAHLNISATPGSLLALALRRASGQDEGLAAPGKIAIAGDAELARRLERLASHYAPDIEAAISRRFGAVLGVPLSRALLGALEQLQSSLKHRVEDGAHWLREEARLSIAPGEMDMFLDQVDLLREGVERLQGRIERLRRRQEGAA